MSYMLIVQIGVILLALLLGYIFASSEYKNLTTEEKEQVKKEMRDPFWVFHVLPYIGYIFLFVGLVLKISVLKYIAFLLMGIGLIIDGAEVWETDRKRCLLFVLIGSILFLITTFLALEFLFDFPLF